MLVSQAFMTLDFVLFIVAVSMSTGIFSISFASFVLINLFFIIIRILLFRDIGLLMFKGRRVHYSCQS